MKHPSEEDTAPCFICKKVWKYKDSGKWVFHDSVGIVCIHHEGVQKWYDNLLKEMNDQLVKEGVIPAG